MSLAMAAMRVRSRQVQKRSAMEVHRLEKSHREDRIMFAALENFKDFVRVICETLERLCKKRRLTSSAGRVKTDEVCKQKMIAIENTSSKCNTVARLTVILVIQKRILSEPISIPTKDRHDQRYPVYGKKTIPVYLKLSD